LKCAAATAANFPNSVAFGLYHARRWPSRLAFAQRGAGPVSDRWTRTPFAAAWSISWSKRVKS
jgi:hypothetical protein